MMVCHQAAGGGGGLNHWNRRNRWMFEGADGIFYPPITQICADFFFFFRL